MRKQITKRQIEIVQLMAEGYKEEEIADKLGISHITLRTHKTQLYKRLSVNNSVSAVISALDLGLIRLELSTRNRIQRTIEFRPEYLQSGISILSYFSTVLQQKNPKSQSIVRIEQAGLNVRLLIIPEKGEDIQVIEKTLEEYGLVISGKMKTSDLLENKLQIMELENKLEISKLELRFAQKQLEYERQSNLGRFANIENEVSWLRGQIGNSLLGMTQITIGANQNLLESVRMKFPSNDKALLKSLDLIERFLEGEAENNSKELLPALQNVKKKNPAMLNFLLDFAKSSLSSTSGKFLYDLINTLI